MVKVRAFAGLRPRRDIVREVACLPYDVMNSEEAAQMAAGKPESLLHVTRAEIDIPGVDPHSDALYERALSNYKAMKQNGWLVKDPLPCFYVYAQSMLDPARGGKVRVQIGIVAAAWAQDYAEGRIKKHELTRPDKEEDRMVLTRWLNANVEPVFFAYKAVPEIDAIVAKYTAQTPEFDFVADDGFGHTFWIIADRADVQSLETLFATKVPACYVADGHHRTAAAARIGAERAAKNPKHTGEEDYNFFMTVLFPDNQLKIMDYNRVVRDLNGLSAEQFLDKVKAVMDVEKVGSKEYRPAALHEFSMYIGGVWYRLTARKGSFNDADPIGQLDVTILSDLVLRYILGIEDLRRSQRIDFVGGIRGLGELKRRVDSGEMQVAFALYPVSMAQLINIADTGNIMPPKTTWFEPKLRSGIVIKEIEE